MEEETIFVSIASYRDPECTKTIEDLFLKAQNPNRVFVGVCQQNAREDKDCMSNDRLIPFQNNIKVLRLEHYVAKGPMYARALIEQNLFNDEMFFLQIDSHMLFIPDWDIKLIEQLTLCDSDRPILTTYPHDFDRIGRKHIILPNGQKKPLGSIPPTYIRFREFHKKLHFSEQEKNIFVHAPDKPCPSLFWAAGFSFSLGKLIHEVPYDEFCDYVFVGEEMLMSMRYFTHGWDLFCPSINIVYHLLKRTYRKVFWEQVYRKNCVVDEQTRMQRKRMEMNGVNRIHRIIKQGWQYKYDQSPEIVEHPSLEKLSDIQESKEDHEESQYSEASQGHEETEDNEENEENEEDDDNDNNDEDPEQSDVAMCDELYGMGPHRTLQDWVDFTGVEYYKQVAEQRSYQGVSPNASESEIYFKTGIKQRKLYMTQKTKRTPELDINHRDIEQSFFKHYQHDQGQEQEQEQNSKKSESPSFENICVYNANVKLRKPFFGMFGIKKVKNNVTSEPTKKTINLSKAKAKFY